MRQNDIEQFYYLLDSKISKEHHVHISHFSVNISYNDGTSREISGIDALNKFLETRDVTPSDVTMSWNIIIKYPKSETIENQRIQLSFIRRGVNNDSEILLVIEHTNQSWGIEVLNLFKDKIAELSIKQTRECRFAKFLMRLIDKYGVSLILMSMSGLLVGLNGSDKDSEPSYNLISFYNNHSNLAEKDIALFSVKNLNNEYLRKSAENVIIDQELKTIMIDIADADDKNRNASLRKILFLVLTLLTTIFFIPFI